MFSDETLFFMFYSTPRDALQEVAAQELWVVSSLCAFRLTNRVLAGIEIGASTRNYVYG